MPSFCILRTVLSSCVFHFIKCIIQLPHCQIWVSKTAPIFGKDDSTPPISAFSRGTKYENPLVAKYGVKDLPSSLWAGQSVNLLFLVLEISRFWNLRRFFEHLCHQKSLKRFLSPKMATIALRDFDRDPIPLTYTWRDWPPLIRKDIRLYNQFHDRMRFNTFGDFSRFGNDDDVIYIYRLYVDLNAHSRHIHFHYFLPDF